MLSRPLYMLLSLLERPFYSCCPCHLAESSSSLRFPLRGQLLQEAFSSGDLSPGMCSSYFLWIRTQRLSFPLGNHSLPHSNPWCSGMGSYFTGELGQSAYSILLATGIVFWWVCYSREANETHSWDFGWNCWERGSPLPLGLPVTKQSKPQVAAGHLCHYVQKACVKGNSKQRKAELKDRLIDR